MVLSCQQICFTSFPSHCICGNRNSIAVRLIGVTVHDANGANVYGLLVLDNLSHTQCARGLRRANKISQHNTVLVSMILDLIINYSEAEPTYKH